MSILCIISAVLAVIIFSPNLTLTHLPNTRQGWRQQAAHATAAERIADTTDSEGDRPF